MKPCSFVAIGGCHVEGYGANGNKSFINVIDENTPYFPVFTRSTFAIKRNTEIAEAILKHDPEMILLQLGNYEFHASIKKMIKKKKSSSSSGSSSSMTSSSMTSSGSSFSSSAVILPFDDKPGVNIFQRYFLLPLIWKILYRKNGKNLEKIKEIVSQNPNREFVFLSPFPCLKNSDDFVRNKAGKFMKIYFEGMKNVTFIDLHGKIQRDKRLFADPFHFNAIGHKKIGRLISAELQKLIEKKGALAAS
jgi:hypothetical protein